MASTKRKRSSRPSRKTLGRHYGQASLPRQAGLAVVKKTNQWGKRPSYEIVQEASELSIGMPPFVRLKDAKVVLEAIAPLAPWHESAGAFGEYMATSMGRGLRTRMRAAAERALASIGVQREVW
jgi:hypothetical protein